MIVRAALVAASIVLALAPLGPAHATDGKGCGGTYSGTTSCTFHLRGLPVVTIFGDSQSAGTASVEVWVTAWVAAPVLSEVPLFFCSDSAPGYARCSGGIGIGEPVDSTRHFELVTCHVGGQSGNYFCGSGPPR